MARKATLQTRGRLTVPAEVREALGLQPGDEVEFVEAAPGRMELRQPVKRAALFGTKSAARLDVQVSAGGDRQMRLPLDGPRRG